jgi:hypothetical protein
MTVLALVAVLVVLFNRRRLHRLDPDAADD